MRSARRRLLTKTMVERWARTSSSRRGWMAGQMERRGATRRRSLDDVARPPRAPRPSSTCPRPGPRPAGRRPCAPRRRRWSRGGPSGNARPWRRPGSARPRARGRAVAERPMRCSGLPVRASRRSRERARCAPALGAHEGVDLVHDHGVDGGEAGPRLRGEEQVERLGGGDEDVGRVARPCARARSAGVSPGADAHRQRRGTHRPGGPRCGRCPRGAPGGCARRPRPGPAGARCRATRARGLRGRGLEHQAVEGGEEGGQRLAGAGGGEDEGGLAPDDGRPAQGLGAGGAAEGLEEPLRGGGVEGAGRAARVTRTRGYLASGRRGPTDRSSSGQRRNGSCPAVSGEPTNGGAERVTGWTGLGW